MRRSPPASPVRDRHGGDTGCGTSSGCPPSRSCPRSARDGLRARPRRARPAAERRSAPAAPRPPRHRRPQRVRCGRGQRRRDRPARASTTGRRSRCGPARRPRPASDRWSKAYNASHKNQVELTVAPTDDYQAKVGAAAGGQRPARPVLGGRRVHAELDLAGAVPGHHQQDRRPAVRGQDRPGAHQGVDLGRQAVRPAVHRRPVGLAVQQGPLPQGRPRPGEAARPRSQEFADQARAVAKLGGDIHGTFFGGNCGGCNVFTWWPIAWADGEKVMDPTAPSRSSTATRTRRSTPSSSGLVDDGTVAMPESKTETGPTWTSYFPTGKIGIMPMPATTTGLANDTLKLERRRRHADRRRQGRPVDLRRRRQHRHRPRQQGRRPGVELPGLARGRGGPGRRRRQGRQRRRPAPTSPTTSTARPTRGW